ncbi:MAG: BatA domain-containing protein, partial [Gemmatimonadota bacterium]
MFRFEDPWVLSLLVLVPLALLVRRWLGERTTPTLRYSAVDTVLATGQRQGPWVRRIPGILRGLALCALVVAAARPQTGLTSESVLTEGIDIVLALDI